MDSGKVQTGLNDTKEIVENLKKKYGFPDHSSICDIGKEIVFAGGGQGDANKILKHN